MFISLAHAQGQSVTGTDPKRGLESDAVLINTAQPPVSEIKDEDARLGPSGGLFYNCAPREVVGSVVYSKLSPYREVERAEPTRFGPVLGVIVYKPRSTICEVIHAGPAKAYRNLMPGLHYFLGPRGTLITPPLDRPELTYVHYVGFAIDVDTLMVSATYPLVKRDV